MLAYFMSSKFFQVPGTLIVLYLGLILIFTFSNKKFSVPYTWWGVQEPDIRIERAYSDVKILRGLKLSKISSDRFSSINSILKNYGSGNSIFAFPNIALMYLLADNLPKSKVIIPWFDFLPDRRASEESVRILKNNPDVIINLILPEIAWSTHERLFRNSNRLGQRDIHDAINILTLKKRLYNLELTEKLPNNLVLQIWTKK